MEKKVVYLELKGEEVISVHFKENDKIQKKLYENKNLLIRIANKFGLIKIFWLSLGGLLGRNQIEQIVLKEEGKDELCFNNCFYRNRIGKIVKQKRLNMEEEKLKLKEILDKISEYEEE